MSNLISREEAIDAIVERTHMDWESMKILYPMLEVIDNLPTVYPKKGKWIVFAVDDARGRSTGRHTLICNQCHGERELEYGEKMPKFCGNCGADMRESE